MFYHFVNEFDFAYHLEDQQRVAATIAEATKKSTTTAPDYCFKICD
jgi:hypothetical protein